MSIIINLGMDVHSTNYTLCCYTMHDEKYFGETTVAPDYKNVIKYIKNIEEASAITIGDDVTFRIGYEAGCLGYTLYHQLTDAGYECYILAPSTIPKFKRNEIKTDKRDARKIAQCLAFGTYSAVYIPSAEDLAIREYIRMRDDHKASLKRIKQQILSLCLRHGFQYRGSGSKKSYWTLAHLKYLKELTLEGYAQDALTEYLITYNELADKIERFDKKIEEAAQKDEYRDKVMKLQCLIGIKTYSALAIIVESGDFRRFSTAEQYASYLGMTPGEKSSGDTRCRTGITKAGNSHIRKILVEAAQGYGRGQVGYKSKALKARQQGNDPEVIAYADRANKRLRKKYYDMVFNGKKANVAKTAIARELACFIWGMMTGNIA